MRDKMARFDPFQKKLEKFIYIFIYISRQMQIKNLENSILIYFLCKRFLKITFSRTTSFSKNF